MNAEFANYVRSASFCLTLSEGMIHGLLSADDQIERQKQPFAHICQRATTNGLHRRGLIVPSEHPDNKWKDAEYQTVYELTSTGKLIVQLLKHAGFQLPAMISRPEPEESTQFEVTLKQ